MGWRSWNCYHGAVNQSAIEATIDAIVDTSRGTSLLKLGFSDVGVDDGALFNRAPESLIGQRF